MKKTLALLLLAALPLTLYSQQKPSAAAKDEPSARSAGAEEDDGAVMIDGFESSAPAYQAPAEEDSEAPRSDPNALPASLGDVRGTLVDAGRNILVLQADDGTVNFVQVVFSRNGASWKPAGSLTRSRE